MKNFSIILPSRGHEHGVKKMLDAFERTTFDKSSIEVLFAIDEGATGIRDCVDKLDYAFDIKFFERPKTKNFAEDYYNWLGNKSEGNNIFCFNDDAWITTVGWDKKILDKITESGWSIYLVDTRDSTKSRPGNYFPTFPIISRKAMATLGYVFHPRIRMFPCDKILYDTFKPTNRIIDANDVTIQHDHVNESDESKAYMIEVFREDQILWAKDPIDVRDDIIRLMRAGERDCESDKIKRIIKILQED